MRTTLNITYLGLSADCAVQLDGHVSDVDVRRIAVELVRNGEVPGLRLPALDARAFDGFVVDRLTSTHGEPRLYLRPKVPFGAR